ncbi:sensor histidine kinase [Belliella marina]|uniref:Sensor histidine kinase n=1 Tax=Belliella marina TaxID=1644146 RepID=A0ABW4VHX1_9BACT
MDSIQKLAKENTLIRASLYGVSFLIIWFYNSILFDQTEFEIVFFYYVVWNYFVVLLNQLTIEIIVFKIKSTLRWLILIVSLVVLYFVSVFLLVYPLKWLNYFRPDDERIEVIFNRFFFPSIEGAFSVLGLSWSTGQLYFHLFILLIGTFIIRYVQSMKKIVALQIMNANLELDLLKSQIHPHFLFNTLNNLYRLVMDVPQAGEVVLKLSDLLRFSLYESNTESISLGKEIEFLEDYIGLEKIRHHSHVQIAYDFESVQNRDKRIAPLIFINFVENAFKHGVNNTVKESWVKIILEQTNDMVIFKIANSKIGNRMTKKGVGGQGLANVRRRLDILYYGKYDLEILDEGSVYQVNLKIEL